MDYRESRCFFREEGRDLLVAVVADRGWYVPVSNVTLDSVLSGDNDDHGSKGGGVVGYSSARS